MEFESLREKASRALADAILVNIKKTELYSGSARSSPTMKPSHVLMAMGLDRTAADESIRISIRRDTTMEDIKVAVADIAQAAHCASKQGRDHWELEVMHSKTKKDWNMDY